MIIIRQEKSDINEHQEIYNLVQGAFLNAEHRDGTEQDLVTKLRNSEAFIPELSLVALDGDKIVGHIMFTKAKLGDVPAVVLAPLAIAPEYQRQGVGAALIKRGHEICIELGYEMSLLAGSEHYYPRFGYQPASTWGIISTIELPDQNFMAINFQGKTAKINQTLEYAEEFF